MNSRVNQYRYLLNLFVYALRNNTEVYLYTLYRCVFIYRVISDFLDKDMDLFHNIADSSNLYINNELSIIDLSDISEALVFLQNDTFIELDDNEIKINSKKIADYVDNVHSGKMKSDLSRIVTFVNVVFSYPDDVILSLFLMDPNIGEANRKNKSVIDLKRNQLTKLLNEFQEVAKTEYSKNLDSYDVFVSWLNFVQSEYLKGKNTNEG